MNVIYINDSDIFEFRENLTINGVAHDFLFYGKYVEHNVINNMVTDYIEIVKIPNIEKYLNGDESENIIVRYESTIPKDLIDLINLKRIKSGEPLISQ